MSLSCTVVELLSLTYFPNIKKITGVIYRACSGTRQYKRRVNKLLWSMVSKAAERSMRQRRDTCRDLIGTDEMIVNTRQSRFSGMVFTVGRLVRT